MGAQSPGPSAGAPYEAGGGEEPASFKETLPAEWAYLHARRAERARREERVRRARSGGTTAQAPGNGIPGVGGGGGGAEPAPDPPEDTVGLALSGGGIRSAAFALGVIQQLADAGILDRVDYLSTVSGGGFLGGAILTQLHASPPGRKRSGTGPRNFPFRRPRPCGRETTALRRLRQHASYLARGGIFTWSGFVMTANYAYGLMVNLLYLGGASVAVLGVGVAAALAFGPPPVRAIAAGAIAIWIARAAWMGRRARRGNDPSGAEEAARRERQRVWFARCLFWFLLLWFVAGAARLVHSPPADPLRSWAVFHLAAPTAVAALLKGFAFLMQRDWRPQAMRAAKQAGIQLVGIALALVVATAAVLAVLALARAAGGWRLGRLSSAPPAVRALAASGVGLGVLVLAAVARSWPVALGSLHDFYKDRIAAAFTGGEAVDDIPLADLANPADPRMPFPIINATVNLPRSRVGERRDPGDLFILTPRHCGSDATGFRPTRPYAAGALTLADAIATSGSAISPRMGVYTQAMLSLLVGFLNLRLGMLVPNPWRRRAWRSGTLHGLPIEWFQFRLREDSLSCYLSDGGHYDNLGLTTLLRRQCELVIVVDAEADPARSFGGLARAIRLARVEHCIDVDLDTEDLLPSSHTGMSRSPCAVGTIRYAKRRCGILVYLKPSLTEGLSADLRNYRDLHPHFPHQGTANQFFSDPQFEAYRALGWQCTALAFGEAKAVDGSTARTLFEQLQRRWRKGPRVSDALFRAMEQSIAVEGAMLRETHPLEHEREVYPEIQEGLGREDIHLALMQMRLMDEVFLASRLDLYADLPENAGWLALMERYARSATFRRIWARAGELCSEGFQYFCERRFGLERARARAAQGGGAARAH